MAIIECTFDGSLRLISKKIVVISATQKVSQPVETLPKVPLFTP
jgi:hypothetical protein